MRDLLTLKTGSLKRCIERVDQQEKDSTHSSSASRKENHSATSALMQILNAAYLVNVQINTGSTFLKGFVDKMKQVREPPATCFTSLLVTNQSKAGIFSFYS